ncbi:hypothetical protein BBC0122_009780 [Bartonella choladocola]|uniref:Uncharacterized protein n=1 Tax=Bartonella choladocola TaxID=2750995 RepID=A0A1U9MHA5_9HYPH|nr:hypothetical protein BBC0122_009780 [Bartonella choladocola]
MDEIIEKSCWSIAIKATIVLVAVISLIYLTVGF